MMETILKWQWKTNYENCRLEWINAFIKLSKIGVERVTYNQLYMIQKLKHSRLSMTFNNVPTIIEHPRSDYDERIDQMADAFTELQRLSGRLHYCKWSPREYFETINPMLTREEVFRNTDAKECTSFRPANLVVIKKLLFGEDKKISIYDPFAGWGDRAIGAAACGANYIGIDKNNKLSEGYVNLLNFMEKENLIVPNQIQFINADSTKYYPVITDANMVDMVFTCPPYFDFEIYDEEQNNPLHPNDRKHYVFWFYSVIQPSFKNASKLLKSGGYFVYMMNRKDREDKTIESSIDFLTKECHMDYLGIIASTHTNDFSHKPQPMFVFKKL
jgi:16S rRNA G966 N2-methylase RsmD